MLARRLVVIAFSASVGLGFALHDAPRQHAWAVQHAASLSQARIATR